MEHRLIPGPAIPGSYVSWSRSVTNIPLYMESWLCIPGAAFNGLWNNPLYKNPLTNQGFLTGSMASTSALTLADTSKATSSKAS